MKKVTIRRAIKVDLPVLLEFEQGIITAERPMTPVLRPGKISYYDVGAMIDADDVEVLVAVCDEKPVGSGYARIVESKPYMAHDRHVYLGFMYVSPEHRGQGIIQMILEGLKNWALSHDIREMKLEVFHNNPTAVRAYEKAGFSKHLVEMRLGL